MQFSVIKNEVPEICRNLPLAMVAKIHAALLQCGAILANETRLLAPEDTGALRASIAIVSIDPSKLNVEIVITALSSAGRPYPLFQEYGWRTRAGNRIEGRFYLKGAFANTEAERKAIIRKAVQDALKEMSGYGVQIVPESVGWFAGEATLIL